MIENNLNRDKISCFEEDIDLDYFAFRPSRLYFVH